MEGWGLTSGRSPVPPLLEAVLSLGAVPSGPMLQCRHQSGSGDAAGHPLLLCPARCSGWHTAPPVCSRVLEKSQALACSPGAWLHAPLPNLLQPHPGLTGPLVLSLGQSFSLSRPSALTMSSYVSLRTPPREGSRDWRGGDGGLPAVLCAKWAIPVRQDQVGTLSDKPRGK